ncbi:MAG: FtsW/RodA/SpoVE family cell cycle protein, partial [Myxococcota bacterium]
VVAALLARGMETTGVGKREMLRCAFLTAVPVALLLLQPDFGSAAVLVAIVALLCFTAGVGLRVMALPAGLAVAGAVAYVYWRPYALARVRGFLDPWPNAQTEGFQLVQSFVAFGRGGLLGVGLGDGRQKLHYLPEAHTDFILAMIAEEIGLVGVLAVLGCFAVFARVSLRVAARSNEPYTLLLVTGMMALVLVPALLNAAVVMGLVPTTGLALPFLSHGSNSLIFSALAVGILLRASSPDEQRPARGLVPGSRTRRSTT